MKNNKPEITHQGLPIHYIKSASALKKLERMEDGRWFAEIPGFDGVWAEGASEVEAAHELEEVLIGWLSLKIADHDRDIPVVNGIDLNR